MGDIDFRGLGDNLVAAVRSRFEAFLKENPDVDGFLVEIGGRYAARTAEYHLAETEEDREDARVSLQRIANTLEMELDAIAHLAPSELLGQLKAALGVALQFAIENLPTIVSMLRR